MTPYQFIVDNFTDPDVLDIIDECADLIDLELEDFVSSVAAEIWGGPYQDGEHVWVEHDNNRLYSLNELVNYFEKNASNEYDDFYDWWGDASSEVFDGLSENDKDDIIESVKQGLRDWCSSL